MRLALLAALVAKRIEARAARQGHVADCGFRLAIKEVVATPRRRRSAGRLRQGGTGRVADAPVRRRFRWKASCRARDCTRGPAPSATAPTPRAPRTGDSRRSRPHRRSTAPATEIAAQQVGTGGGDSKRRQARRRAGDAGMEGPARRQGGRGRDYLVSGVVAGGGLREVAQGQRREVQGRTSAAGDTTPGKRR